MFLFFRNLARMAITEGQAASPTTNYRGNCFSLFLETEFSKREVHVEYGTDLKILENLVVKR